MTEAIRDPLKAYTAALAEFKSGGDANAMAKLLRSKREAVKETMTVAGTSPDRRQELAGAAQVLEDILQDLARARE